MEQPSLPDYDFHIPGISKQILRDPCAEQDNMTFKIHLIYVPDTLPGVECSPPKKTSPGERSPKKDFLKCNTNTIY